MKKNYILNILLLIISLVFALWFADTMLGWVGFPTEVEYDAAYPPGHSYRFDFKDIHYTFQANSLGIRYEELPLERRSPNETRVVVLGDSFTQGEGVEDFQTFSAVLENKFSTPEKKTLFINCGVSGAGPCEYACILYQVGLKYQPDKVLVVLYANDLEDISLDQGQNIRRGIRRIAHEIIPHIYIQAAQFYYQHRNNDPVNQTIDIAKSRGIDPRRLKEWEKGLPESHASRDIAMPLLEPNLWVDSLDIGSPRAEKKWAVAQRVLSGMAQVCKNKKIPMAWAYIPHPYQYDPYYDTLPEKLGLVVKKSWMSEESELQRRIRSLAKTENIPFLDLTADFRKAAADPNNILNFRIDQHLNVRGHVFVAQRLRQWLPESLLGNLKKVQTAGEVVVESDSKILTNKLLPTPAKERGSLRN